jgi:hypothetical protein
MQSFKKRILATLFVIYISVCLYGVMASFREVDALCTIEKKYLLPNLTK